MLRDSTLCEEKLQDLCSLVANEPCVHACAAGEEARLAEPGLRGRWGGWQRPPGAGGIGAVAGAGHELGKVVCDLLREISEQLFLRLERRGDGGGISRCGHRPCSGGRDQEQQSDCGVLPMCRRSAHRSERSPLTHSRAQGFQIDGRLCVTRTPTNYF
jgi:hypothetical protein